MYKLEQIPELSEEFEDPDKKSTELVKPRRLSSIKNIKSFPNFLVEKSSKNSPLEQYNFLKLNPEETQENFEIYLKKIMQDLKNLSKMPSPSKEFIKKKSIKLPPKDTNNKKTLFLDLDETLVHTFQNSNSQMNIRVRPFCKEFLYKISEIYEIYIFTAAKYSYAETVINFLDPEQKLIDGIISREQCLITKTGNAIKDLRIILNRDLKDMILIDNSIISFGDNINNCIPIPSFFQNDDDSELLLLIDVLMKISEEQDARNFIKNFFQLEKIQNQIVDKTKS